MLTEKMGLGPPSWDGWEGSVPHLPASEPNKPILTLGLAGAPGPPAPHLAGPPIDPAPSSQGKQRDKACLSPPNPDAGLGSPWHWGSLAWLLQAWQPTSDGRNWACSCLALQQLQPHGLTALPSQDHFQPLWAALCRVLVLRGGDEQCERLHHGPTAQEESMRIEHGPSGGSGRSGALG